MKPFNIFLLLLIFEIILDKLAYSSNLKKNSIKTKTRKSKKQYNPSYYPSYADSSKFN